MNAGDDQRWAPPGAGGQQPDAVPPAGPPPVPNQGAPWSPPAPGPIGRPPVAPPPGLAPGSTLGEPAAVPDRVEVPSVEADRGRSGSAIGRIVAAGAAAVMLGGGAYLVANAASAQSGADSPEAAFETAMAAVEAEDVIALAEIMEPSERDTVFEAGFDFVDELVRLEVLDPGVDLSSIEGIDLEFEGFEPRVEWPGNGLAHIYVGEGTVSGSIDVASLPLGPLLVDRMDAEQLSYTESSQETSEATTTPMVAVERDGRWYLSYWYTMAENIRIELDAGLPDQTRRPLAVGGDSPEAAVRRMMDEAFALDLGGVIGTLDPEEMAVLYDYAPLFLDDVDELADVALSAAADAGWSWQIVDLGLSSTADGDLATVQMESIHFRADGPDDGLVDLQVSEDGFSMELALYDDWLGTQLEVSADIDGECVVVTVDEGNGPTTERLCGDDLGLDSGASLTELTESSVDFGIVTRQVDGVWYVSPVRTGLDAMITAIEQVDPQTLQDLADGIIDFGLTGFDPSLGFGSSAETKFAEVDAAIGGDDASLDDDGTFFEDDDSIFESETFDLDPSVEIEHIDLLGGAPYPDFGYDVDPSLAPWMIELWVPELRDVETTRGAYGSVFGDPIGGYEVLVLEVADIATTEALLASVADSPDVVVVADESGSWLETTGGPMDGPVLIALAGPRLIVVAGFEGGTPIEELQQVMAAARTP